MKLIIREHVDSIIEVRTKTFDIIISAIEAYGKIPKSIGQQKGDLIVFNDAGSPVRFGSGTVPDKVLMTDPTSPTGWKLGEGGGGGGGGSSTIALVNNSGVSMLSGTAVKLAGTGEREIEKATSSWHGNIYITSSDCDSGDEVACYSLPNTICSVLCDNSAISEGDRIAVSSTAGICHPSTEGAIVGIALSSKESGNYGYVKVLLKPFSYTISSTDIEDGITELPTGHFYYVY